MNIIDKIALYSLFTVQALLIWPIWKSDIFIVIFKGIFVSPIKEFYVLSVILSWVKMEVKADNISGPVPPSGCLPYRASIQFRQDLWL